MRTATQNRYTNETKVDLTLNIDGDGNRKINTGIGFFDHMLELFSAHSHFDLDVNCVGDLDVDCHHTIEDIGIALGKAFNLALGDKRGIVRYSNISLPMDESLVDVAVDISGRPYLVFKCELYGKCGDFDNQMVEEFMRAFAFNAGLTLHINLRYGNNLHHIVEAVFKGVARCLAASCKVVGNQIPSSKGVL